MMRSPRPSPFRRFARLLALLVIAPASATAATPPDISSGLVLYAPFDGGASQVTIASALATVTGTTSVTGLYGNALHFNGAGDRVTLAQLPLGDFSAFTVTAWVNPDTLDTSRSAVLTYEVPTGAVTKKGVTTTTYGIVFGLDATRSASPHAPLAMVNVSGSTKVAAGKSALPQGRWSHLAMTYDGTSMTLYVNGAKAGSVKAAKLPYNSSGKLLIGATDVSTNQNFAGGLDDVRLYGRVLTASELQTLGTSPNQPLTVSMSATPDMGTAPLAVNFTATASQAASYAWDFGDSQNSAQQNPSHTYGPAGSYTAKVTATSGGSTATASKTISVSALAALSASVSGSPLSGAAPLAVAFAGKASGGISPYTFSWNFGDGSTSAAQNPGHTYSAGGIYAATLTVTDSAGQSASTSVGVTATAATTLNATASGSPTSGAAPLAVTFTGGASGGTAPYRYSWSFGDGSTSTSQNPSHSYSAAGSYTATLTATDAGGQTAKSSVAVTATAATACTGKTYYVSSANPSGTTLANGGDLTVQNAIANDQLKPGDTLYLKAGVYGGFILGYDPTGPYGVIAGTAACPITIAADPAATPGTVVIGGRNNKTAVGIDLEPGVDYVRIASLTIDGTANGAVPAGSITNASSRGYGVKLTGTGDQAVGNTIKNLIGCATAGIHDNGGNNGLIQGNTITGVQSCGQSTNGHGIYVADSDGVQVVGNTIHDNAYIGIHINGDPGLVTHAQIMGNQIYNNPQNGINADGLQSSTVANNVIYGYTGYGIVLYQIDASGPGKDNVFVNNTIVSTKSGAGAAFRATNGSTPNTLYNNVLLGGGNAAFDLAGDSLTQTAAYNVLPVNPVLVNDDTGSAGALPSSLSAHSVTASAAQLFVNPAGNDYHLLAGSPAIDAATSTSTPATDIEGTARPQGAGFDIGAYEFH